MKRIRRFDQIISQIIQRLPKSWYSTMLAFSFLGEPWIVLIIGFASFISAVQRHQPAVQKAFIWAALTFAISTVLKLLLRRNRPHNLNIRTLGIKSYSFPSGHAFGSVIFYGLFSYFDFNYLRHPVNILISLLLASLIVVIGLSRIYLKLHYPSDVVAGWLLGLICLIIVINLSF